MASTPRERAPYGLRGDRIGEAYQPGPVMEAPGRAFSGAEGLSFQVT